MRGLDSDAASETEVRASTMARAAARLCSDPRGKSAGLGTALLAARSNHARRLFSIARHSSRQDFCPFRQSAGFSIGVQFLCAHAVEAFGQVHGFHTALHIEAV